MKRTIYILLGCISTALGAVGTIVPILPTVPFLMLAAFCFARSSERLHRWFVGTKLYQENLESFVKGQGMTTKTKLRIITVVTLMMGIGFVMMSRVPVARMILALVWVAHLIYFVFGVKTCPEQDKNF